ncbi:MAG TPA: DUF342 domain-containing protein [Syntrophomonadaceae bacterium]|nr:DUF342 domain-containing protein [Syntrophomonadaceae bacterium]
MPSYNEREYKNTNLFRILEFTPEGVYLTVSPLSTLKFSDLEQELNTLSVTGVDWNAVNQALQERSTRCLIAPPQEVSKKDGEVIVGISQDEMEAYLTVFPPINGNPVTREAVLKALEKEGVVFGIDYAKLDEAIQEANPNVRVVVARGKPAVDGKDAEINYSFPLEKTPLKPVELENGRVDYYNLNLVHNIKEGQVLATKTPATQGEAGYTVRGNKLLPRAGRDLPIRAGKNTQLTADGMSLKATTNGHVVIQDGRINVYTTYIIPGDVDFSTGNIEYVGSVRIIGSIKSGFTVKADGDVEVGETVEGGSIIAGRNVIAKEGIRGLEKGSVVAKGSVFAKFLENAKVQAGENVIVGESIMHSNVSAGGKIIVDGRKGFLVGGICRAGEEIEAKTIGSNMATVTELEVGVDPEQRVAYNKIVAARKEIEKNLDKVEKALHLLKVLVEEGKTLPPEKESLLSKLEHTRWELKSKLEEVMQAEENLFRSLSMLGKGKVKVNNHIHPGVIIRIGNLTYYVRDEMKCVVFAIQEGEVRAMPCS